MINQEFDKEGRKIEEGALYRDRMEKLQGLIQNSLRQMVGGS